MASSSARRQGVRERSTRCLVSCSNFARVMRISRCFGPVASVIPFQDEREAVELANDTIYGLSASLWTRDLERALRVARAIESGVVSVNTNHSVHVEAPFGGLKRSGFGRDLGMEAMRLYTEVKNIFVSVRGLEQT